MKVCQEIDVDGVTIIINRENKLEAILPEELPNQNLEFEEVELTNFDMFGSELTPQYITEQNVFGVANKPMGLIKLVRLKGTNYFMFKLEDISALVKLHIYEYFPEGEAPKIEINTSDYTYKIYGSLKLKTADGTYLTDMLFDTTGKVSGILFNKFPQNNTFISINGEYSGTVGEKRYELVSTMRGLKIQDELGTQSQSVTFNMEAPDQYGNTTQHNVTVEVRDDEIVVFGSGKTTLFGDPKDSYPAFFADLFGYASGDFNYVKV